MSNHPLLIVKARHIVRHSHLSDEDKQLMFERIPYLDSGMISLFIMSAEENPFAVDAIVKNMKKKLDSRGNLQNLHSVLIEEEKEILEDEVENENDLVVLNN